MRFFAMITALCATLFIQPAAAQEDEGFLTRKLQELLSDAGREVDITGFEGALSSEASMERMTIADDAGIWLILEDVTLIWSRSALLRGRLEVDRLTARRIDLPRLPNAEEDAQPQAEATPFSLPDLPVSIDIREFAVETIDLGAPVIGEAMSLSVTADARLDADGLVANLNALRKTGQDGRFDVAVTLERADNTLTLKLNLDEAPGGIAARLLDIPEQPSVKLAVDGSGPIDAFDADIVLATDGQERLAGAVSLAALPSEAAGQPQDRRVSADISGDVTAILLPAYRDFFGTEVALTANALLRGNGAIDVEEFALDAAKAQLAGRVTLGADKWPLLIDIEGQIAAKDGAPVLLPGGGGDLTIGSATLDVSYDRATGDSYVASFDIKDLDHPAAKIGETLLTSRGTLTVADLRSLRGDLVFEATGLRLTDAASAEALGSQIFGNAQLNYAEGAPFAIEGLTVTGADYGLAGQIQIGTGEALETLIDLSIDASDISRFSALAGREMAGAATLRTVGTVLPLSGGFDQRVAGTASDIVVGIAQVDALAKGDTELSLSARRDETGTFLRGVSLRNEALTFDGDALLRTNGSDVTGEVLLRDVGAVLPQYSGPVRLSGKANQIAEDWRVDFAAEGPYQATFSAQGLATGPDAEITFALQAPQVSRFVPNVPGALRANGVLRNTAAGYALNASASGPYNAQANVQGTVTGAAPKVDFSLQLPDIGVLVDKVNGPLTVTGNAAQTSAGWRVETDARGISGTEARIAGLVANSGNLDLTATGSAPLGLVGPFIAPRRLQGRAAFDLTVNGAPALSSVRGTVRTQGATLSAPNLRLSFEGLDAVVRLDGRRANIEATANAVQGGRLQIAGGVGLSGGNPADIGITLTDIVFTDPRLYRTSVSGQLALSGPLSGGAQVSGAINLGETEVSVPSTGLTSIGDIPPITHIGAPQDVTATRRRADLIGTDASRNPAAAASGPGFGLNVQVNAPRQIFVRGRGLDAELGGNLLLGGTTNRMISSGRFDLLRGRLNILGKRFDLEEGEIRFEGDLVPYIRFVSSTPTDTGEVRITIEGPADAPEVTFASTPEAAQDEVLAQLLFGRNISEISAFQALQLANAVAVLAGRSSGGLISRLRGNFGLDDLDVTTTDDGATALRAGKYISDNVYTDVTAASDGTGEVSLNLDLSGNLKAKGTLGSDGNSSLGLFFEKDY